MNSVVRLTLGNFMTNSYLFSYKNNISLIDIGGNSNYVFDKTNELNRNFKCTILTHNHLDHIRGLDEELFEKPIYMHSYDLKNLTRDYLDYSYNAYGYALFKNDEEYTKFKEFILSQKNKIIPLHDGDNIEGLKVLLTSGHTKGSITLINDEEKFMFTGDTIFENGGYGRTDLESGNYDELVASLQKLSPYLQNGYKVYSGH